MATQDKAKFFIDHESVFIKTLCDLESKRLEDLKNSRETVYKYALPASIIEGVLGGLSSLITGNFVVIIPAILLLVIVYLLALNIDIGKQIERNQIISLTEKYIKEMDKQHLKFTGCQ